ncbi:MAG: amidophosphoribosyltransferase [Clostridioides sp.]|jgi:amidophosphoribosyltransferase|nr:amidophosphoribosyltransferase [Clostridioides sp.]
MCGIIGMFSNKNIAKDLYYGLYSIQHRGQESCGLAVADDNENKIKYIREMGLVGDVFKEKQIDYLNGSKGIGHVRYSTAGGSIIENCQPFVGTLRKRNLAVAHNGNLVNAQVLKDMLEEDGYMFQTNSDTEVILYILARYYKGDIVESLKLTMDYIKGAYALVILCDDALVAARDPHGFRPLIMGKRGDEYIFASENCAIDILGGEVIRDVEPGEIIVVKDGSVESFNYSQNYKPVKKSCIFEHVYFARNDATIDGVNAYDFRIRCGEKLAENDEVDIDLVVPVPDSGWPGALGYANAAGMRVSEALVKNRYVGRTFIKPTQEEREIGVKIKLNPLKRLIKDKSIVLVDDSIVRGTTSRQLVKSLREAGAREIHLRITSPPVAYSCFYGIDTPNRANLIASNHTVEEMRDYIGCDTLKFIDINDMLDVAGSHTNFCKACFDGDYAVKIHDIEG